MNHLNLLTTTFRRRALVRRRLRQWLVVWILGLTGTGSIAVVRYYARKSDQRRLTVLQMQCEPLQRLEQESTRIEARLAEIHGRESLLEMLERTDQPVQLIGIVSRSTGGEFQDIYVEEFSLIPITRNQLVETTDENGHMKQTHETVEVMQLNLNGLGTDDLAVARFVASLRESGVFEEVLLKSSTEVARSSDSGRRFLVDCNYR